MIGFSPRSGRRQLGRHITDDLPGLLRVRFRTTGRNVWLGRGWCRWRKPNVAEGCNFTRGEPYLTGFVLHKNVLDARCVVEECQSKRQAQRNLRLRIGLDLFVNICRKGRWSLDSSFHKGDFFTVRMPVPIENGNISGVLPSVEAFVSPRVPCDTASSMMADCRTGATGMVGGRFDMYVRANELKLFED